MGDEGSIIDCKEMTTPHIEDCNSELLAIKLDLCDDSNNDLQVPEYLIEDNLKTEFVDTDVTEISVGKVSTETKTSPLSKSRYGRIHKPKIDEDFLSTDKKVGAILGILCTPQKNSGVSSKASTPRKLWQSPNSSASDGATSELETSAENLSRSYRDVCDIFSPQKENFKGFSHYENGPILSSVNDAPVCNWKPGDLAWARVGHHPYWPCIVTVDPTLQTFKKIGLRGVKCYLLIHVQFYGDKGRRSWLSSSAMRKYEGLDAFNKLCEQMTEKFRRRQHKMCDPFIVKLKTKVKWDIAVTESEAVYSLTREMRLLEFISKYQTITADIVCLDPEPHMNMQVKRKVGSSSEPRVTKKVCLSQEGERSYAMLVKKKLSLSDDGASQEKRKKVPLSQEIVKVQPPPLDAPTIPAGSPPEKKKVQAKLEQFFSFTKRITPSVKPELSGSEAPPANLSLPDKLSECKILPVSEPLQEDGSLATSKIMSKDVDLLKCEPDDSPSLCDVSSKEMPKQIATSETDETTRSRKSLRLSTALQDKITMKPEVSTLDEVSNTAGTVTDSPCVQGVLEDANVLKHDKPSAEGTAQKDDSGDEWLPNKRKGSLKHRDCTATSEQVRSAPTSTKSKALSEEDEAFYQFNLVHTQIVMDDNPYWSRDKVDSYVRLLWNNLDDDDKAKFGKRTDAEKKKFEGGKVEKPAKRMYVKKKKVEVSDDESSSSLSSEEQEGSKEGAASLFTFRESKPASLFRGMRNEKVCQVCEMAGNTVKCKGPCLGFYHLSCISDPGTTVQPAVIGSSTELVSSDSGVEESDSDIGDTQASNGRSACNTVSMTLDDSLVVEKSQGATAGKVFIQEIAIVDGDGDGDRAKKMSAKKKPKKREKEDESEESKSATNYLCPKCLQGIVPACFACSKDVTESGEEKRQRCVVAQCGKFYHPDCLKLWPQAWFSSSSRGSRQEDTNLTCPQHTCHTCASDDPRNFNTRFTNERLVRCVRCPTAYHFGNYCVPAGSIILNMTQIICSRHCNPQRKGSHHVNAAWCFICAMGGSLICCDLCPTSFHAECLNISPPEGGYICEDCGTGRFPLYGEIVWAKLGHYRWWPAQIVFPDQVPENIENLQHSDGEFVVRFFGSHDYNWVNRSRVFLYQEGDSTYKKSGKTSVDTVFQRAVNEAQEAHQELNLAKASREAEPRQALKPPQYVKIKCNKPVGNVRVIECDPSNLVACYCDPKKENPCGPDSDCLNRILMVECSPAVCRAGDKCRNQRFEKREYPPLIPYKTDGRGWGLKTLADIKKGDFVIEYVGEMIDEAEYKRRLERKHLEKDENYYFLTIDKDRMLDAGPKGNVSRFMNHSCQPNCETQKWTVNGDTRVGLFALEDIPANTEVTFNYNLQCASTDKKQCMCGAPNCSGFIGSKASKVVDEDKKQRLDVKGRRKQQNSTAKQGGECFQCGQNGDLITCDNKTCPKKYHLKCVNLPRPLKGKWTCPWHQCNICKKHRTSKRCAVCPKAYCSQHEEGNIFTVAKEVYCKEHSQGSLCDGSSRSASGMSTDGSEPQQQQPVSSDLGYRGSEVVIDNLTSRASCSKYRTPGERRAERDLARSAKVIITEVSSTERTPGSRRKSARKCLSLQQSPYQRARASSTPEKADSDNVVKAGNTKITSQVDLQSDMSVVDSGTPVRSRAGRKRSCEPDRIRATFSTRQCGSETVPDEESSGLVDTWLAFSTDDEISGSSVKDDRFCEFQESRRKDLLEMRRAQVKRIGQKVTEMCQAKSLDLNLKELVDTLSPVRS